MPTAPTRVCGRGHVAPASGKCPACTAARHAQRASNTARGYDRTWDRLRRWYRQLHPLCEACKRRGVIRAMHDVDHIVPFTGVDDPRRLDPLNLQSLCTDCHREKTVRESAARGPV